MKLKAKTKRDQFYTRLVSSGPVNELLDFMVSPSAYSPKNRPNALSSRVLSSGALSSLSNNPKPFITQFDSGHIAVVARVPGEEYTDKGKLSKRKRAHLDTTKIVKLLSPAVPSMVQNAGLVETANELIADELPKQIEKAIQRTLKKAGKA